mmetsp:Transcript_59923/g.141773  ORF Transcript_59923/g.141773 Transcript_59923/m.141773 type:complete len:207 (-) Transcript_59923:45-665(-)
MAATRLLDAPAAVVHLVALLVLGRRRVGGVVVVLVVLVELHLVVNVVQHAPLALPLHQRLHTRRRVRGEVRHHKANHVSRGGVASNGAGYLFHKTHTFCLVLSPRLALEQMHNATHQVVRCVSHSLQCSRSGLGVAATCGGPQCWCGGAMEVVAGEEDESALAEACFGRLHDDARSLHVVELFKLDALPPSRKISDDSGEVERWEL